MYTIKGDKMKLYVIRHAQTDGNLQKVMIGSTSDIPINNIGISQAEEASNVVKDLEYDMIICSPMLRTKQTCAIVNSIKNKDIIFDDRIIEMAFGSIEGLPIESVDLSYWNYYSNIRYDGAATMREHCQKVWDFLYDIKEKYSDKNILIVTHNEVCRAIGAYFNGLPSDGNLISYGHNNCEVKEYSIK